MLTHYKTLVVEYEAMQSALDHYAQEGWRLHSVTAHSQRSTKPDSGNEGNNTTNITETIQYLLIFLRDDRMRYDLTLAAEEEPLESQGFSLPEY
jgi:hypothetical protein